MQEIRRDINQTLLGLILYTLLRYGVFAIEPYVRKCYAWLVTSDSDAYRTLVAALEQSAGSSGIFDSIAVLVGVLFLGWYFHRTVPPKQLAAHIRPMKLRLLLLLACIFMGAQLVYSLLGNLLEMGLRLFGLTAMNQLSAASGQSETVSMFLYTAVFAPIGEELIYRGFVLQRFRKYGNVFAIAISALLFAVMHANLFQMPFAFLTGLVLGYTAAEFSVHWSIVLHIANNLLFGELLSRVLGGLSPTVQDYIYRGINIVFFAFAAFWLIYHREMLKKYLRENRCAKKCYAAAFTAIAMLVFLTGNLALALSGIHKM